MQYGESFPAAIEQAMRNMKDHPVKALELWLPKNMPAHYEAAASALVEQGVVVHRTDGKVYRKSDIVRRDGTFDGVWVDEAPDIGGGIAGILLPNDTVSYFSYAAPRLSFLAKCVRQCFGISSDLTIKTNSLFFL